VTVVNIKVGCVQDTSAAAAKRAFPWPAASATGIGSMPGTSPDEALKVVLGELPDFPYLPELPDRGPGADLTGRTAALLVELPVETTSRGWKFALRPGREQRRAADLLATDLDALLAATDGYQGPFKIQVAGPWTLAATIELSRSQDPALADSGAVDDLIASLTEGVAAHVAEVRARVPGADVVLQVDEPALPAVLAGAVPTASGLNRVGAVDTDVTRAALAAVLDATSAYTVVHCCSPAIPFQLIRDCGARAVALDISRLRPGAEDSIGELAEAGLGIVAGALDTRNTERMKRAPAVAPKEIAASVVELWRRIGLSADLLAAGQVVISPACGLAGFSGAQARTALAWCREAARITGEMIEGETQ
jgi:methionine synthase II (cobalamin-independent)